MDPNDVYRLTALAVFLVAGIDVGLAFLFRAVRESVADGSHD